MTEHAHSRIRTVAGTVSRALVAPWSIACASARMGIFVLKVFPMLPSKPVEWVTKRPIRETVTYPTSHGLVTGDLYRPSGTGRHRAMLVCLGVVPFGVDHPQVPRLGEALARAVFVALLHWSPAMRDFRLDPGDIDDIALAFDWLIAQPYVEPKRSGLVGTCVGGSFSLMAAGSPRIRDRLAFVFAYAPYSSMWTFLQDIASATTVRQAGREAWAVDPLTRKVFVHSLTGVLERTEGERLRGAFADGAGEIDIRTLSEEGRAVYGLLTKPSADSADQLLHHLPSVLRERLSALSPTIYLSDIRAPVLIVMHDRGDNVIPVGESRRLHAALAGRAHYSEMEFQHLNPRDLPIGRLLRTLCKFYTALYPLFR
jgi:hypothetical protein